MKKKEFRAQADCKKANRKALCTWLILLMYLKSSLYHTDFNHCTVVGASGSQILNTIYPEDQNSILKMALTHKWKWCSKIEVIVKKHALTMFSIFLPPGIKCMQSCSYPPPTTLVSSWKISCTLYIKIKLSGLGVHTIRFHWSDYVTVSVAIQAFSSYLLIHYDPFGNAPGNAMRCHGGGINTALYISVRVAET